MTEVRARSSAGRVRLYPLLAEVAVALAARDVYLAADAGRTGGHPAADADRAG